MVQVGRFFFFFIVLFCFFGFVFFCFIIIHLSYMQREITNLYAQISENYKVLPLFK